MNDMNSSTHFVEANAHGGSIQAAAKHSLQRIVDEGMERTSATIQKVINEVPEDRITSASALGLWADNGKLFASTRRAPGAEGRDDNDARPVHEHALGQLCGRVGVPTQYARELIEGEKWQRALGERMFREHASHTKSRILVRSHGDSHRAFLSDKYRRLDSRPLLDAFVSECQKVGAVPVEGVASDVKCAVRAIIPRVIEPVPGEAMIFGLNWQNSDYGSGSYAVSFFAMRLLCTNGMVGESNIKQVHLGSRLPDNLALSARTYRHDTETMASATQDVVRGLLSSSAIDQRVGVIARAASKEVSSAGALRSVRNSLSKAEQKAVKDAFEGGEEILLPAGNTAWRFSNALSWVANQTESPDRKIELQHLAGKVVA